jgi:hypothetical protein
VARQKASPHYLQRPLRLHESLGELVTWKSRLEVPLLALVVLLGELW